MPVEVKEEVSDAVVVAEDDKDSVTDRVSDSDHDDVRVAEAVTSEADSVMDFDTVILMESVGVEDSDDVSEAVGDLEMDWERLSVTVSDSEF